MTEVVEEADAAAVVSEVREAPPPLGPVESLVADLLAYRAARGGWGPLAAALDGNDIHNTGLVSCRAAARMTRDAEAQPLITRLLAMREVQRRRLRAKVRESVELGG